MKKLIFLFSLMMSAGSFAFADNIAINHFEIRENPYAVDEISVVATDTLHNVQENVNGQFLFTINGFEDTLKFTSGVAFYKHKMVRSTFLYARHINETGTHSILYYVYKNDKLTVIHISWIVLLAIPLCLILLAYMFKRFIIVAIIILAIFVFFNYHNGLSIPTFFESIIDGLKGLFKG
jgi:hypothetical protein